ncbi:MAG: histidine kinase dimerization/phospho-acceptor domain-containing protein, partial [Gemmatimonadota bacterium]
MKRTDPAAGNSQEALALSIARVVQLGLPGPDSPDAIRDSVSEALHSEACENELTLAHIRIVVLLAAGATLLLSAGRPELLGLSSIPASLLVVGTIWLAAAVFLDVALSRGWYRRWLRKAVPLMDALGVTGVFGIILWNLAAEGRLHPIGLVATAALGCASIIVSGVLRLSRSGARFATGSAVAAWIAISFVGRIPVVTSLVVGGLILATGLLVWRSMRSMRGVITNEVSRLRLTRMYQEAQEAIRTREEVLKIVSHDLRNPLSTIAMATNMLIEHPASEDRQARNLAIIKRAGERMNRMIHDLLDAA